MNKALIKRCRADQSTTRNDAAEAVDKITHTIVLLRGKRVILDAELATLYGVSTKRFNEQVRRNIARFPEDFMFQLTAGEQTILRSQSATSKPAAGRRGGRRYLAYAFTEHGAIQAANVLNSSRAAEIGIYVVRAFVRLRELLASNRDLVRRLDRLEAQIERKLGTHDEAIAAMLAAIRELMKPLQSRRHGIGFTADLGEKT